MPWVALVNNADGDLVSVTSDVTLVADPLPVGIVLVPLAEQPNWRIHLWDRVTRALVPRPAQGEPIGDRMEDIRQAFIATTWWSKLTVANRVELRDILIAHLPRDKRYYDPAGGG